MYYELITNENQNEYENLIPREYRGRIELGGVVAAGIKLYPQEIPGDDIDDEAWDEELTPAGAMVLSVAPLGMIELLWIEVVPESRKNGISSRLLEAASELVEKMKLSRLIAIAADEDVPYFSSQGFKETGDMYYEWSFEPREMKGLTGLEEEDRIPECVSYQSIPKAKKAVIFEMAAARSTESAFSFMPQFVDPHKGFVWVENGEPEAGILVERLGPTVRPVLFFDEQIDDDILKVLLKSAFHEIREKIKGDVTVHFRVKEQSSLEFCREILEGIPCSEKKLVSIEV